MATAADDFGKLSPRYWRTAQNEVFLGNYIPFSSCITPHDVLLRGGDLIRIWRLAGVAFETASDEWVSERHEAMCSLLRNLSGGQFALYTHRVHRVIQDKLPPPTWPPIAREFDEAYSRQLAGQRMMANELYLTQLYRAAPRGAARVLRSTKRSRDEIEDAQHEALRIAEERSAMVSRVLREFDPHLLGDYEHQGVVYSEVEEFLGFLVNGSWTRRRPSRGPLYRTLPNVRFFFGGDKIEIRDGASTKYAAVVDIAEYPAKSEPGILNALLYEDTEFIETQSFAILPRRNAMSALERQRDHLISSEDVVTDQIAAMDDALNLVGDGQLSMGEYHYSLIVFGDSVKDAGRHAAEARGAMGEAAGVEMVPVDLVADAAWFAQWPGNFQWRPREASISSRAFSGLASQHNFAVGKRDGNPWGPAVMLLRTPSGQPYYLNLHASPEKEDSEDKRLAGNTLILGVTGSGKTTLETAMLLQTQRFDPPPRLVMFGYDRDSEIFVRAMRGPYFNLRVGRPSGCNPLQREPTPARLAFWERLIKKCIESPALPLLPKDEQSIARAVRAVAEMPKHLRRFSTVRQNLPTEGGNSLHARLGRWCKGGPLAWVFDESDDQLLEIGREHVIGFDYTEFVDDPEVRTPIMMYLLDVMGELVDGRRVIYQISEAWRALNDVEFKPFIKSGQKTIRKNNGLGLFDTQSPSDILLSEIGRTMVEQSVTIICLPNPAAVREEYVDGFGLTDAEYEIVLSLSGRRFLVKQGHQSAVAEMDLSGMDDFIVLLSGSKDNAILLEEIRAEVGEDPDVWIPILRRRVRERDAAMKRR